MNSAVPDPENLERFRSLPLFADLGDSALRRVQGLVTELQIPAGQILVHAGDPGAGLFVIEEGTAIVEGRANLLIEVGPGEFVGELALLVARGHAVGARPGEERRPLPRDRRE